MPPIKRFESSREMPIPVAGTESQVFLANSRHSNRRPPDLDDKDHLHKMKNKNPYRRVIFSGSHMASGMSSLKIWSPATGDQLFSVSLSDAKITDLGKSRDHFMLPHDPKIPEFLSAPLVFCPFQKLSRRMTEAWVGMTDGRLHRIDLLKGVVLETINVHQASIWSASLSTLRRRRGRKLIFNFYFPSKLIADDNRLLTLSLDGLLQAWTPREGGDLKSARIQLSVVKSSVTIRPNIAVTVGDKFLWIASYKTIEVFEEDKGFAYSLKHKFDVGSVADFVTCMTKSMDGKHVFTGHNDSKIGWCSWNRPTKYNSQLNPLI